jgi:hypothetical protein
VEISETDACTGLWNLVPALQTAAIPARAAPITSARYRSPREKLFTLYTFIG